MKKINWKFLSDEQLKAIKCHDGPSKVVAGAGTGKTTFIIYKVLYLILKCDVPAYRIGVITFTNKAKKELQERLYQFLKPDIVKKITVKTYHGLCNNIVRYHINDLPDQVLNNRFQILSASESRKIVQDLQTQIDNYSKDNSQTEMVSNERKKLIKRLFLKLSKLKRNFIDITSGSNNWETNIKINKAEQKLMQHFEKYKKTNNLLDFDDLLVYAYACLKKVEACQTYWLKKIQYWLVDEFQDTDKLQFAIIQLLNTLHQNLTVVGDPDQNIYSWRGSENRIILEFQDVFKNAKTFYLKLNYRSHQAILSLANDSIQHNQFRDEQKLVSNNKLAKNILPSIGRFKTEDQQNQYIIKKIKELKKKHNYEYKNFLILYRFGVLATGIKRMLDTHQIPAGSINHNSLFTRPVIQYALSFLYIIVYEFNSYLSVTNSNIHLWKKFLLGLPNFGIKTLETIENQMQKHHINSFRLFFQKYRSELIKQKKYETLYRVLDSCQKWHVQIHTTDLKNPLELKDFLTDIFQTTHNFTFKSFAKADVARSNLLLELILQIQSHKLENNDSYHPFNYLATFLQTANLASGEEKTDGKQRNIVRLSTIHAAKGTESKVVFLIYFNEGIIPSAYSKTFKEKEEERRNLHVALTRAEKYIFITSCPIPEYLVQIQKPFYFIDRDSKTISPYLKDLNSDFYQLNDLRFNGNNQQYSVQNKHKRIISSHVVSNSINHNSNHHPKPNHPYRVHDKINHLIFGEGTIVKILPFNIKIKFNNGSTKIIHINDVNLIKICS